MVILKENKLLIEIEHPCPVEFVNDLAEAIISVLQNRELSEVTQLKEFQESNFTMLELLKQITTVSPK